MLFRSAEAQALRAAARLRRLASLTEDARGYVFDSQGVKLGRIFENPTRPGASCHVACHRHSQCSVWVMLRNVPDTRKLSEWLMRRDGFETAVAHKAAFNDIVYGSL